MMTAAEPSKDSLKLQVRNFGPIVEADIDLRPLTLFVGPSNTGKSYLAILIYALQRLPNLWPRYHARRLSRGKGALKVPNGAREELLAWARAAATADADDDLMRGPLPDSVASLVRSMLDAAGKFSGLADLAEYEFSRCFGVAGTDRLIRRSDGRASEVVLQHFVATDRVSEEPFQHAFSLVRGNPASMVSTIPEAKPLYLDWKAVRRSRGELSWMLRNLASESESLQDAASLMHAVVGELAAAVFPYIFGRNWNFPYYLPADRTGVMHAHQVVVSALVGRAADAAFDQESPLPTLSGVLADFLRRLIALERPGPLPARQRRLRGRAGRGLAMLAQRLEEEVLSGEVRMKSQPGLSYPAFFFRPEGWKDDLPLMRSSSMVSELAPVVLYLRYVVQPGDTLIIEEPEAHLHPAKQVEFMRSLATMVQAGIRVIMTTHSEWVLEELANLVRASALSEADRKSVGDSGVSLRPEDVGAWLFRPKRRPKGSVVQEIPMDPDSNLYPAGYDDVAFELHNRGVRIDSLAGADAAA